MGIKDVFKDVGMFIKKIVDYLQSEEGQEQIDDAIKVITQVASVVVKLLLIINHPLTPQEKRELARRIMEFLREVPMEDFEKIVQAKRDGLLDEMTDQHLDGLIGNVTAFKLKSLKKEAKKISKKRKGKSKKK